LRYWCEDISKRYPKSNGDMREERVCGSTNTRKQESSVCAHRDVSGTKRKNTVDVLTLQKDINLCREMIPEACYPVGRNEPAETLGI
jgi:hypothetical protein